MAERRDWRAAGARATVAAVPSSAISSSDRSKSSLSLMANSAVCGGTEADAASRAGDDQLEAEISSKDEDSKR